MNGGILKTIKEINHQGWVAKEEGNTQAYNLANQAFHMAIWEASGSEKLKSFLALLWNGLSMNKLVTAQEYANISYREHTQIIETIAKGDYDEACVLMGEHIKRSMNSMLMNFAKEGVKAP